MFTVYFTCLVVRLVGWAVVVRVWGGGARVGVARVGVVRIRWFGRLLCKAFSHVYKR